MILQKQAKFFYTFLPLLFILFPLLPSTLPRNAGNQIVFAIELIFVLICGMFHIYKMTFTINSVVLFILFFTNVIISIFCDIFNNCFNYRNLYETVNPLAFLLFYTFYRQSNVKIQILERCVLSTFLSAFLLLSIYSIIEFFFPAVIRPVSIFLYQAHAYSNTRAAGSFGISYQFGYILLFPLIYSVIYFFKYISVRNFLFFILLFITLLLTQSRSIYITCAIAFLVIFCLPYLYSSLKSSLKIIFTIFILVNLCVTIYITYQTELSNILEYAIWGFKNISQNTDGPANIRTEQLYWAINNNKLILFGSGIGKGVMMLESFYSLYYYRYGLINMIIYLLMLMVTAFTSYKIFKHENHKDHNSKISIFYLSLFIFFLISPVGLLNSNHQDTPKISFLFYGLIGLVFNKYHTIKKIERESKYLNT